MELRNVIAVMKYKDFILFIRMIWIKLGVMDSMSKSMNKQQVREPKHPDVPCARFLTRKGLCGKPSMFLFCDKNSKGLWIHFGLCEKHSAENGVEYSN